MDSVQNSKAPVLNSLPRDYPPLWMAFSVWGLGALFYLIAFFHRVSPAVMTQELMLAFGIGAAGLGNLSAFYFYAYFAMQIPTGVMADTLGPRKLLTGGAMVATLGAFLFALSPNLLWAIGGRGLIGVGVAVSFISTLKLASTWFPARRFALASGLGLLLGTLGAVLAGAPLRVLIKQFGWRPTIFVAGLITAVLAVFIYWLVRNDPSGRGYKNYLPSLSNPSPPRRPEPFFNNLSAVLRHSNIRFLALAAGGIAGTNLTFGGLWGVPYIKTRFGIPTTEAALMCSGVMIAAAVAGPILGWFSDWVGRRKSVYLGGAILTAFSWAVVIYIPEISLLTFTVLILLGGFGSGAPVIGFAYGKESVPPFLSGTAIGIINMGVIAGPTILQPAIGAVLDLMWGGQMSGGVRVYDVNSFKAGFGLMLGWAVLGAFLVSRTQETFCRQRS